MIIDGKECRYWFRLNSGNYRKCSLRGKNDNCEEIKDCFVKELLKQLKRKEQECERLKADLKSLEYTVVLQSNRDIDNATDLFAKRIAKIENENSISKAENKNLKQALTEIKEIAETCSFTDNSELLLSRIEQILQLISEVKL